MALFSSFLTSLIIPLNLCITCLVIGTVCFIARRRKTGFIIAMAGIGWAVFWSLPASSLWAGGRLEQMYPHMLPAQLPKAQAIVVLGGNTANNRQNWFEPYDKDTAWPRIDTAALLYRAGRAPTIILSGAALEGKVSEAQAMAHALEKQGIPELALIMETHSYTTHQNGTFTAAKLRALHIKRILLVTSALHMPRAMAVFRKLGVSAIAAPAPRQIYVPGQPGFAFWLPDMRSLDASRSIIKEYVGLLVYWLRGWV
ncbi:MAG TPA: YdcF family protein [Burkholderiaceae bacterium]|nr:YdcF family protein [Burkholderiaceae bacterium]